MENQHRKISGYRELSQEEIDLMNRIKAKGSELLALHDELNQLLVQQAVECGRACIASPSDTAEFDRFHTAEPMEWAALGKRDIQTGIMALVRAVAQPEGV